MSCKRGWNSCSVFKHFDLRYCEEKNALHLRTWGDDESSHMAFFFSLKKLFFLLLALQLSPYQHSGIVQYDMDLPCTLSSDKRTVSSQSPNRKEFIVRGGKCTPSSILVNILVLDLRAVSLSLECTIDGWIYIL